MQNVNLENMNSAMSVNQQGRTGNKLSEAQMEAMNAIISKYDSSNLSEDDEKSMRLELKNAGISPSRELASALETAGFEVRKPQGKGGMPPPNRPQGAMLSEIQQETLDEILSKYDPTDFTEEDDEALRSELEDAGIFPGRELGAALNKVGLGIKIQSQSQIPSGIIFDDNM